jgi:pSer/pThr/pTyr-binding forkhead associated (FHA) protein
MGRNKVAITVLDALMHDDHYEFDQPCTCVVGRAADCDIRLLEDDDSRLISRHHCLLDIDPPRVRLWDLGSTNGTFVNGERIDRREPPMHPADTEPAEERPAPVELATGDEIQLGNFLLVIELAAATEEPQPGALGQAR